jgi:TPP-dependent pyruvate/acetoin dehydrogenase alpha subunit
MKTPARKGAAAVKKAARPKKPAPAARKTAGKAPGKKPAPAAKKSGTEAPLRGYDVKWLKRLYHDMVLIREFEERVKFLFLQGVMPGTIHQYQGQEACAVGVCAALSAGDVITSTHRPHGHALARGITANEAMAELFGKVTGCCKGKGGSMHMGDLSRGMLPAVAIVGGGLPIAAGMALSFKMSKENRVAVGFMGDGATSEGIFHEAVNMAAIWDLPVLYVVENNLYGASTHVSLVMRVPHIADRAAAYGIPGFTIDGNDVIAVYEAAKQARERARLGKGPTLLELLTYRITGHSRRDPCLYQPEDERKKAIENEPIGRFARRLLDEGIADQKDLDAIRDDVKAEIERSVEKAMSDPLPRPEDTLEDMFV